MLIAALIFGGCATRQRVASEPVSFVFKTPSFKIAASGFLQRGRTVRLQGYNAGQPVFELLLGKRVCLGGRCMSYAMFNSRLFTPRYPAIMIRDILEGRPIMQSQNLEKRGDGFVQEIKTDAFAIIYRVKPKEIYFKDSKNRILIKIKELD